MGSNNNNNKKRASRRMYAILTASALALMLFSQPVRAAEDDVIQSSARQMEKICGKLTEILAAKTSIPLPVAKVRMGKMHLPYVSERSTRAGRPIKLTYFMLLSDSTTVASPDLATDLAGHACRVGACDHFLATMTIHSCLLTLLSPI